MPQSLKISIISDADSWMNPFVPALMAELDALGHEVRWVHAPAEIPPGDLLFCLSCTKLIPPALLARNRHNLVVHQSALPKGRGWSPLAWQILAGANVVPVSLIEAAEAVDSGVVYARDEMRFEGTELVDELREAQARCSIRLVLKFVGEFPGIIDRGEVQVGEPTYYPRRRADASRLDPDKTLREQFNLLRIADNDRYPAYFELGGERYVLKIEKAPQEAAWVNRTVPIAGETARDLEPAEG